MSPGGKLASCLHLARLFSSLYSYFCSAGNHRTRLVIHEYAEFERGDWTIAWPWSERRIASGTRRDR